MQHHYLVSNDISELEKIHDELVQKGIDHHHMHLWSNTVDANKEHTKIIPLNDFLKTDIIHSTLIGAAFGFVVSGLLVASSYYIGHHDVLGLFPYICAALVCLGLFTWEGGLWGIQETNHRVKKYKSIIKKAKYMLILDYKEQEYSILKKTEEEHKDVRLLAV
jgi:hypothetical protein